MVAIRSNFGDILAPGHFEIFTSDMDQWPEEFSKVFNLRDSKRRKETTSGVSGFTLAPEKAEGASISYDDPVQGYDEEFIHLTYALGYRISRELWEDDLYSVMDKMPKELSKSMQYTVEVQAANVFINGFTDSAAYLGPDGEPLFGDGTNKNHPLTGGGNEENQLSTAADLSVDSAELMVQLMEETTNERGLLGMLKPSVFVVPPESRFIAKELFDPMAKEKPNTTLRNINPLQGEDWSYFVWHWLTDPDAWFLLATEHKLMFFWRVRPDYDYDTDFDSKDYKGSSRMRFSKGWEDWRGVAGSPGA